MRVPSVSLFEMTKSIADFDTYGLHCSKITLVNISHILEDIILKNNIPALMFTGFQESSHWSKEVKRYQQISDIARQVCIFAGKPLPQMSATNVLQVELDADDLLRQEWFVIIISESFNVVLTGKDNMPLSESIEQPWRTFETILTFDPTVIKQVLNHLEDVLIQYRPEMVDMFKTYRERFHPYSSELQYISYVTRELLAFEEKLNQEIRDEHHLNTLMIQSMRSLVVILDSKGIIQSVNPAFASLIEQNPHTLIGQSFLDITIHKDAQLQAKQALETVIATHAPRRVTTQLIQDETYYIDWDFHPMQTSTNDKRLFVIGHDITEREHNAQLQLEEVRLRTMLESERTLSDLRKQFITTVSHEFRTPLTSILNSAEMLEKHSNRLGEEGRQRRTDRIKDQVKLLTAMVEDISLASKLSEGKLEFSPVSHRVNEAVENILKGLNQGSERVHLASALDTTDEFLVDVRLLRLILLNLVANALKYSPLETQVVVRIKREGSWFVIDIEDTGEGIPKDDMEHIYEPFYRGSNTIKSSGSGMGLHIVRDCVRVYRGIISFDTSDNGTIFTIKLPIPIPQKT